MRQREETDHLSLVLLSSWKSSRISSIACLMKLPKRWES